MFKKQVKCSECGYLSTLDGLTPEISSFDRSDLTKFLSSLYVSCFRGQDHLIAGIPPPGKPISQENLIKNSYLPRRCKYYYPYNPGYTPGQHLELQRERTQRRFLIIVSLLSAAVGAGIATAVNFIFSIFSR